MIRTFRPGRFVVAVLTIWQFLFVQIALAQQQLELPGGDISAPKIMHESAADPVSSTEPVVISATVTDDSGVRLVTVFYRSNPSQPYSRATMERVGSSDVYMVSIPADEVVPPGIEYYIQAADVAGNTVLKGFAFSPLTISVAPGQPVPAAQPQRAQAKPKEEGEISTTTWILIGVGAALLLGAAGGGGGGGNGGGDTGNVLIGAPVPE